MNAGSGCKDVRYAAEVEMIEPRVAADACDVRRKYTDNGRLHPIYPHQQVFVGQFRHCKQLSVTTGRKDGQGHPAAVDQRIDEHEFPATEEEIPSDKFIKSNIK